MCVVENLKSLYFNITQSVGPFQLSSCTSDSELKSTKQSILKVNVYSTSVILVCFRCIVVDC